MASSTTTAPSSGFEEILLDARVYIGKRSATATATAGDLTRNKERIEVSFCPALAPLPSRLYVYSPDLDSSSFSEIPRILRMVDGLILIRVAIRCRLPRSILMDECDYFIYRVGLPPSLKLLPHPKPAYFEDTDVGLLPRGDQYTIAALVGTNKPSVFKLHTFHSEIGSWTSITMSLDAPPEYPRHISRHVPCLSDIYSHTVITLGGEGGTMGWVDLWRGILLCDVRSRGDINLRFVPVPLPLVQLTCNDVRVDSLGCPEPYRGIAYIKGKNCLRFVDLEFHSTRLDGKDKEIGWTIRTWSNFSMTGSRDDWKLDRQPVHARNIDKSKKMHCQLRDALQQEKSGAACLEMKLQNLCVSNPTPSMNGRNVVYLRTKAEFMNTKACVLAVDMENIKLQYVVEFGAERAPCAGVICHPVSISRLLMNQAASQGGN